MHIRPCLACGKPMEGVYDKRVKYHPECIPVCKMAGCGKKVVSFGSGLCAKHDRRWRRGQPETNPCKGCGTIIDSRYKWCPDCKTFHRDTAGNRSFSSEGVCVIAVGNNVDCPKRKSCKYKGCATTEELKKRKRELFGTDKIRGHVEKSDLDYERKIYRMYEYGKVH